MFPHLDLLFSSTPLAGPEQMALDELLLQTVEKTLLRIYRWKEPCVTFGYFQQVAEVRRVFPTRPLVRRWTGGGAVEHESDITFSLSVPAGKAAEKMTPIFFYESLHKAMVSALQSHGIKAHLATAEEASSGEACFRAPAVHDLLLGKQKILGGAQRRSAGRLLYQGSLLLPKQSSKVGSISLEAIFHSFVSELSPEVTIIDENPDWLEQSAELARKRYRAVEWLERR